MTHAIEIKKHLTPGSVVGFFDKNTGSAYEECPCLYFSRFNKEVFQLTASSPHDTSKFFLKLYKKPSDIISTMEREYKNSPLNRTFKWQTGVIPRMHIIVKFSDMTRNRLISASHKAPMRSLYKFASKALTSLLQNLPKKYTNFTLHNISKLSKNIDGIFSVPQH